MKYVIRFLIVLFLFFLVTLSSPVVRFGNEVWECTHDGGTYIAKENARNCVYPERNVTF